MMKKVVFALIILLAVSLLSLYAELRIDMLPYQGFSGIPVGTNYYKGTGNVYSSTDSGWPWCAVMTKYTDSYATALKNDAHKYYYTDKEMIGIIGLQNYGSSTDTSPSSSTFSFKGPVTITVTAPNGLYLESQADPYYHRPIEIWLYPSYYSYEYGRVQKKLNGISYFKKISNSTPTVTILDSFNEETYEVWFDVVLVLPGTLDTNTNEIVLDDGTRYPLKDADDYSCLVTISAEYYDNTNSKTINNSITIPFSGYYDSSLDVQTIADNSVSMNIDMDAKAYNIDIDSERGKDIRIGDISFIGAAGSFKSTDVNAAIFFSSSSSPFTQGSTFAMVLDSLSVNEGRTSRNSIPFTLRVKNGTGDGYITFDGTTYAESSWTTLTEFDNTKFIIPQKDSGTVISSYSNDKQYFKRYESDIVLQLESNDITMIKGRYEGEIYVHVVTV